jgi:hypothetical protein
VCVLEEGSPWVPEHLSTFFTIIFTLERRDASTVWHVQCICVNACVFIGGSEEVAEGKLDIFPTVRVLVIICTKTLR